MKKNAQQNRAEQLEAITAKLEQGVRDVFTSGAYQTYLQVMSRFHHYSFQNSLLIAIQCPGASHVAGYASWKTNFSRQVLKGSKAIKILAPSFKTYEKEVKLADGTTEIREEKYISGFFPVNVFDVSQTTGEPLPSICKTLSGDVDGYKELITKLEKVSPVPVTYKNITDGAHGYFDLVNKCIAIRQGMSELQTVKTLIHEISHAILHDKESGTDNKVDRRTAEVEAESSAYVVTQYLNLDSSEYSFGYIAGWSADKELDELKRSLDMIRKTADTIIKGLEEA